MANHSRATNSKVSRAPPVLWRAFLLWPAFSPRRDQSPWQAIPWHHHADGGHLSGKRPGTRQSSTISACPQICRPCATICCHWPSHAGTGRRHQKVFTPCRWPWRFARRHRKISCWYPPKQSRSVRRKPEKSTSIHLNSKKICKLLVFRRAEMASWYWYLRIYQRFLWVSTWVLGFTGQKEKAETTFFLVISAFYGLFWTSCWCRRGDLKFSALSVLITHCNTIL